MPNYLYFSRFDLCLLLETTDLTIKEIAERLGVSYEAVRKAAINELKIDLVARRERLGKKISWRTPHADAIKADLLSDELTVRQIAKKYDVGVVTVYEHARKHKVDFEARKRRLKARSPAEG